MMTPAFPALSVLLAAAAGSFCLTGRLAAQFTDTAAGLADLPAVPDGFAVTLFAREPLVRNPCSLAFDAAGRMFVGMGPQYRNPAPDTEPDRIVIVEDTDADGVADRTRTFATGFNCIQGLAWHGRDLWVANAPDLTVVRDVNGDDVADEYVRVFTDLGNIEHGLHGLHWAPDGRLHMSKGNSKGVVLQEWKTDEPDRIAPRPFRELRGVDGPPDAPDFPAPKTFPAAAYRRTYQDPRDDWGSMGGMLRCDDTGANLEIVARGFRNPYDIAFDDGFDWLGTDQDQNEGDRIIMPFFGADFGWSHAWSTHWTGENHLPTVPVSGPVFPGSGTGIVWADSAAWPAEFRKVWIINDWLLKTTHVYRPVWDGALMQPKGGKWEGFVRGAEALYRPVDLEFGADGALYILGWGRGYGVERDAAGAMTNEGRIFRVMPKGAASLPPPSAVPLAERTVAQLVAEFEALPDARRSNAQDELVRRGAEPHAELMAELQSGKLTKGQETWLLWTLARSGAPDGFFSTQAAEGALNRRIQALRILGHRKSAALAAVFDSALSDPEARLRFAAIQAAHQGKLTVLAERLVAHAAVERDRVTFYTTWRALRDLLTVDQLKPLLFHGEAGIRRAALLALLDLRAMPEADLHPFTRDPDESLKTVAMLGLGKQPAPPAPPSSAASASTAYFPAANIRAESGRAYLPGILAAGGTSHSDRPYTFQQVPDMLGGAFQIRTANEDDHSRGESFLTFDLALESTVMVAFDTRVRTKPAWLQSFADTDLTVTTNDTTFRLWAKNFPAGPVTLGGNLAEPERGVANYFVVIQPKPLPPQAAPTTREQALAALPNADPRRGEALFFLTAACATCHRAGERGTNFGPDLTNAGARMEAGFLVQSMLEPNAVITEGYSAHVVEAGGQSHFGMLLSTGKILKLGLLGGATVEIPAGTITKHETLAVSPMPPQGALLGPRDVADITAWLLSQKPEATTAKPEAVPAAAAAPGLGFVLKDDRVVLTQAGRPLGDFVFRDPKIRRPYFANLRTPDGLQVTRNHPPVAGADAVDHADMHPGIWLGFGDINSQDFWRNKAGIEHLRFTEPPALAGDTLTFAAECRLVAADGNSPGVVLCRYSLQATGQSVVLTWDAAFTAGPAGLTFGDQEEMGFGARMATALTERNGGRITNSAGQTTAAATWGRAADWSDYSGEVDGRPRGVTLMAAPENFRPSWWHNRDYGVFVANPFGRAAMGQGERSAVTVKPGESLRLRFAAVLHSGEGYDPAAAWRSWASP